MPNSYGTEPDRGEAVNLARTVLSQPSDPEITNKGIVKLAQTVLAMDDWILAHTNGPTYEAVALLREYMNGTPSFEDWQRRVAELLAHSTATSERQE